MKLKFKFDTGFLPIGFWLEELSYTEKELATKYIEEELSDIFPSSSIVYSIDWAYVFEVDYEELLDLIEPIEQHEWFYIDDMFYIDEEERDNLFYNEWPSFEFLELDNDDEVYLVLKYIFLKRLSWFNGWAELINT